MKSARFPDELDDMGWQDRTPISEVQKLRGFWLNFHNCNAEKINKGMPQFKLKVPITDWVRFTCILFTNVRAAKTRSLFCSYMEVRFPVPCVSLILCQSRAIFQRYKNSSRSLRKLRSLRLPHFMLFTPFDFCISDFIPIHSPFWISYDPEKPGFIYPRIAQSFKSLVTTLGYSTVLTSREEGTVGVSYLTKQVEHFPDAVGPSSSICPWFWLPSSQEAVLRRLNRVRHRDCLMQARRGTIEREPRGFSKAKRDIMSVISLDFSKSSLTMMKGNTGQGTTVSLIRTLEFIYCVSMDKAKLEAWSDLCLGTNNETITRVMSYWIS